MLLDSIAIARMKSVNRGSDIWSRLSCQLLTCMVFIIYDFSVSVTVSSGSPQTGRSGPALHVSSYHGEKIRKYCIPHQIILHCIMDTPIAGDLLHALSCLKHLSSLWVSSVPPLLWPCSLFEHHLEEEKLLHPLRFLKRRCNVANWHNHINQDYTDYLQLIKYKYKTHSGKANFAESPI